MMKKGITLLLLIVLFISACGNEVKNNYKTLKTFNHSKHNNIPSSFKEGNVDVEMQLKKVFYDVKTKKIELLLKNNGEQVEFGTPYEIETFQDGSWRKVPFKENIGFTAIGIMLKKGKSYPFSASLEKDILKYKIKPGFYRVIKEIYITKDKKIKLASIFQIQ